MMTKERSRTLANLKLLLVLPVIAIVLIAFSSCRDKPVGTANTTEEIAPPPPPSPPPPPPTYTVSNGDTTWAVVDEMPLYKGGNEALRDYVVRHIIYPQAAALKGAQGQVVVRFVVKPNGTVGKASVLKGFDPELDAEAIRVIGTLPVFEKPGYNDGRAVAVWYILPINFALN
jgi:TonB family protein